MRAGGNVLVSAAVAIIVASCATDTFRVAGIPTFGRIQDISVADIEAALAAYKGPHPDPHDRVGEIEVVSHDEIRFYQGRAPSSYVSRVRKKGKWELGSVVLVHSAY